MARAKGNTIPPFMVIVLLLVVTPPSAVSLSFSQYRTLFSLAHSLITRVANLRSSRGDFAGASRARSIAQKLEGGLGLGFWNAMWNMGWDYLRNYAWRDVASLDMLGVVSDVNELMRSLNDLTRIDSESEKVEWMKRNYTSTFRVFNSLFGRLLKVFRQSGPLRDVVETLQREVIEGDLLRDCLELGSKDLNGLLQIFRDIAFQFTSTYSAKSDL